MERRALGRTGLTVSRLGFGGAPIGLSRYLGGGDRSAEAARREAEAALREAVERGIDYFDTAPGYGDGLSEAIMGAALAPVRDRITLATKVKADLDADAATLDARLADSLTRLRTDRVELLQIHGSQFDDAAADRLLGSRFLDWLARTKADGRARFLGITAETPSGALERLLAEGPFDALQIAYSVIYQGACDHQRAPFGIVPYARDRGLGIVAMRTATSGVLQKWFARAFPEIAPDRVTEAAIAFALATPEIDVALVGMARPDEVARNAALAEAAAAVDLDALHAFYFGD